MNRTTSHPDEGLLQALADEELDAAEAARVERHVEACAECRAGLADLKEAGALLREALAALDPPRGLAGAAPRRRTAGWWTRFGAIPRAAVLVLAFGGVAWAIPGSPLRDWVRTAAAPAVERDGEQASHAAPEARGAQAAAAAPEGGVSITPGPGAFEVVLRDLAPGVRVVVELTDGPRAGIYAADGAAGARFTAGPERVEAVGASRGELRVHLPAGVVQAMVTANGEPIVASDGSSLRPLGSDTPDEVTPTRVALSIRSR